MGLVESSFAGYPIKGNYSFRSKVRKNKPAYSEETREELSENIRERLEYTGPVKKGRTRKHLDRFIEYV